jgi:aminomethyltransferase
LSVGAATVERTAAWIREQVIHCGDVVVLDTSARYALLALEGPGAEAVLQRVTDIDLPSIRYYGFVHGEIGTARVSIARASVSGEDGFQIFVPPRQAPATWTAILDAGQDDGVVPAGVGARDTLRLEAGVPGFGCELGAGVTPLEAGLDQRVDWEKAEFVGREALGRQRADGVTRRLAGFEMDERAVARRGHSVHIPGQPAGTVTSGTVTPFLRKAIGLTYVPAAHAAPGEALGIDIRGRRCRAHVVSLPFYMRPKG